MQKTRSFFRAPSVFQASAVHCYEIMNEIKWLNNSFQLVPICRRIRAFFFLLFFLRDASSQSCFRFLFYFMSYTTRRIVSNCDVRLSADAYFTCYSSRRMSSFLVQITAALTPSLPQPVKFPGWMMHGHASKQYIFQSYNIYFWMLCVLMEILSHVSAKKRTKGLEGFKFCSFVGLFKMTS